MRSRVCVLVCVIALVYESVSVAPGARTYDLGLLGLTDTVHIRYRCPCLVSAAFKFQLAELSTHHTTAYGTKKLS